MVAIEFDSLDGILGTVLLLVMLLVGPGADTDCCVSLAVALFAEVGQVLFSLTSLALPNEESTSALLLSGLFSLSFCFGLVVEEGSSGLMLLLVGSLRSLDLILCFIPLSFVIVSDFSNSKGLGEEETLSPVGTDSSLLALELGPITVCSDLFESDWASAV